MAKKTKKLKIFPIVEAFGFPVEAVTPEAIASFSEKNCPFAKNKCEKFRQYGFGYCSVTYAAAGDEGISYPYAVCDHRVDGPPLELAVSDHFKGKKAELIPEVVMTDPRTSFDYVAVTRDNGKINDAIAIETQAIDIRGGGVGPAWKAWVDGKPEEWREYFTKEAKEKNRKDIVAYGVNMANIYKRLGLQVATKGTLLKAMEVPFYVVMQDKPFQYLKDRVRFDQVEEGSPWDVTFMTFDYRKGHEDNGQLLFNHSQTVRTTLENYIEALSADHRATAEQRKRFIERVDLKSRQLVTGLDADASGGRTGLVGGK